MAITVNTTDTFEQWRVKTNQISVKVANVNISGSNVIIGVDAGRVNQGICNTFLGCSAGRNNTSGSYNTFIGASVGLNNCEGSYNTFIGWGTGVNNTTGYNNTFLGFRSGANNSNAVNNTFIGSYAGYSNTTGLCNTFIGTCSGYSTTTGGHNVFIGHGSGRCNTTGCCNFFAGYCAGRNNITGNCNTFIGFEAGCANTSANNNFFIGFRAGCSNTTGSNNIFIGQSAGAKNISGCCNTFLGYFSGYENTTGNVNTFIGYYAGYENTFGNCNTFLGFCAGRNNSTGCNNVFLGYRAGCGVVTGVNNTIIGNVAGSAALSNTVIIAAGSNVRAYIDSTGNVGIGTTTPTDRLDVCGNIILSGTGRRVRGDFSNATLASRVMFQTTTSNDGTSVGAMPNGTATNQTNFAVFNTNDPANASVGILGINPTQMMLVSTKVGTGSFIPLTFSVDSERMRIDTSGNVGIGTSSPTQLLDVNGNVAITGSARRITGDFSNATDADRVMFQTSTTNGNTIVSAIPNGTGINGAFRAYANNDTANNSHITIAARSDLGITQIRSGITGTGTYLPMTFYTGGSERVRVDTSGDVGVGTDAPATRLHVQDTTIITAGVSLPLRIDHQLFGSPGVGIGVGAEFAVETAVNNTEVGATIEAVTTDITPASEDFDLVFKTMAAGAAADERMRINSSGICVNGNVKFGLSTNTNTFLGYNSGVSNTGCNNTFTGFCAGYTNTTGNQNTFIGRSAGLLNVGGFGNTFLGYIAGCNNTSGNNNTFIGCLAGAANTTGCNNIFLGDGSGFTFVCTTTQSNRIVIGNANHTVACIQIAWTTPSDVRDKIIFGPVPFGKSFLRQINPITYSYKNRETNEITDDRKRFGFCAQEISALQGSEDIIVNTNDPNKLGMSHEYLIPVLVNAIKELADELDELRAEIQQLKSA